MFPESISEPRKIIKKNFLIKGDGPAFSMEKIMAFKKMSKIAATLLKLEEDANSFENFRWLPESYIQYIHEKYGEQGLFKLQYLAMGHSPEEFKHFMEAIKGEIFYDNLFSKTEDLDLVLDNPKLPTDSRIQDFNIYFCQPSLSRKMYNPGRHHGYFAYGFGGPRILVSHPFKGVDSKTETYDIYANTIDLLTSLLLRGYRGTFLFLDYLPGLNYTEKDIPAWLHWFSIIAIHSDLVIYVKDPAEPLGKSQKLESEFTPSFIQKKMVEIPFDELKWAKKAETEAEKILYVGEDGMMSQKDWYDMEASHAKPFIDNYVKGSFPKDRFIKMLEDGQYEEYPLSYKIYS